MQKLEQPYTEISLNYRQIALVLIGFVAVAAVGHIGIYALPIVFKIDEASFAGIFRFFHMGKEGNFPTCLSALNLLFAGGLCALIAHRESILKKRYAWHWWGLSAGLLMMSLDEAAQVHEGIVGFTLVSYFGRGEGIFYYRWYLVYIPIIVVLACLYLPFIKRLPLRYSSRFMLSALVFLSGAIGVEIMESYLSYSGITTAISILVEETLEMTSIVILIQSLLLYLADSNYTLKLNFDRQDIALARNRASGLPKTQKPG